jgi:hypothetical protein
MYLSFTIGLVLPGGVTVVRYMPSGFLLPSRIYLAGVFYFMNKKLYASMQRPALCSLFKKRYMGSKMKSTTHALVTSEGRHKIRAGSEPM